MLLHAGRQYGLGGPQPIMISESLTLAAEFGCDKLEFAEFVSVLDAEFLAYQAKKHDSSKRL
jgi:hypothetical protein